MTIEGRKRQRKRKKNEGKTRNNERKKEERKKIQWLLDKKNSTHLHPLKSILNHIHPLSSILSTFVHFHSLLFTFIHLNLHPLSSIFIHPIHFIHFHPQSTFIHFIHFCSLSSTLTQCHPCSVNIVHWFHLLSSIFSISFSNTDISLPWKRRCDHCQLVKRWFPVAGWRRRYWERPTPLLGYRQLLGGERLGDGG